MLLGNLLENAVDAANHANEEKRFINPGCNTELMEPCHALKEYMLFVKKIREYRKQIPLVQAMEQTVTECISEGILAGFLKKN
ncbi:MAG: hypothetical protein K2P21_07620 [Lachnospiraceae bacterium]|nr:hypothetical protein [Lachnospiraceae bacterium]